MYSPLKKYGAGPKKDVGIVGIGGLGHFGLLIAKAMESKSVVAISRSSSKKQDALDSGATGFIATGEDQQWYKTHRRTLDIIVCTADSDNFPINSYLQLLKPNGVFVQVGASSTGTIEKNFTFFSLLSTGISIASSLVGSPGEIRELLKLVSEKNVVPLTEERKMSDCTQAVRDQRDNKAKYRYILVNENFENNSKL
jgi:alcohol dehydrogenase (NADP+)